MYTDLPEVFEQVLGSAYSVPKDALLTELDWSNQKITAPCLYNTYNHHIRGFKQNVL
ncbi:hypothetical protein PtB15_16B152 [Puccinia triticina]|nr:hypothetical protein PtB15_16B152 [Puccinia triticina]